MVTVSPRTIALGVVAVLVAGISVGYFTKHTQSHPTVLTESTIIPTPPIKPDVLGSDADVENFQERIKGSINATRQVPDPTMENMATASAAGTTDVDVTPAPKPSQNPAQPVTTPEPVAKFDATPGRDTTVPPAAEPVSQENATPAPAAPAPVTPAPQATPTTTPAATQNQSYEPAANVVDQVNEIKDTTDVKEAVKPSAKVSSKPAKVAIQHKRVTKHARHHPKHHARHTARGEKVVHHPHRVAKAVTVKHHHKTTPQAHKKPNTTPHVSPTARSSDRGWAVRVGVFSDNQAAASMVKNLTEEGYAVYSQKLDHANHHDGRVAVYAGPQKSQSDAEELREELKMMSDLEGKVVHVQ